jgi:uncharacterized protein involved in tolerance to divalent cations
VGLYTLSLRLAACHNMQESNCVWWEGEFIYSEPPKMILDASDEVLMRVNLYFTLVALALYLSSSI